MGGMSWMPDTTIVAAWLIFLATYVVVALGKIPIYRIDRAGAALLGASLMVATGVLSLEEAYQAVDFNTVVLLLAMMIVVANLRLSGFFGSSRIGSQATLGDQSHCLECLSFPLGYSQRFWSTIQFAW
jgi:di/tricarboxylate transporter